MTAPSYTEDLTDVTLAEEAASGWAEPTATGWTDGGTPTYQDGDTYIQGTYSVSQTGKTVGVAGLLFNYGSGITVPTDGAVLVWQMWMAPTACDTYANGGLRVMIGSALNAFYSWDVGGRDFARFPYGGWHCHAVNPTVSVDDTAGSPSGTQQYMGAAVKVTSSISKGNPHCVDAIRYGRGSSIFEYGDLANGYCTFTGYAAQNDNTSYRWGLIQAIPGGYLYKGKMTLGTTSNAVDFRDSNVNISIDNTPKVTANFNTIEVNNASSRVDWTNVKFTALGTASPGRLVCNANADLNWDGCQFTDMSTFTFGGTASTCTNAIFLRCGQIDTAGGTFNGTKVLVSTVAADSSAMKWDVATDPDGYLDNMTFSKGTNSHHALELGTSSPTEVTLRGWTTTDFSASNGDNHSTFHVKRTTGTVTINVVGGTGNFTYKTAGATVVVNIDPVTATFIVKDEDGDEISGVRVLVEAGDGTGDLPFEDSVTITHVTTTATVSHTGHGLATGAKVAIRGATPQIYNGPYTITKLTDNSYSYTLASDPGVDASGSITSTGIVVQGTTDVNGQIAGSRVYSVDQNIRGNVRKGTSSPYYKEVSFTDTIDSVTGLTKTIQLTLDE